MHWDLVKTAIVSLAASLLGAAVVSQLAPGVSLVSTGSAVIRPGLPIVDLETRRTVKATSDRLTSLNTTLVALTSTTELASNSVNSSLALFEAQLERLIATHRHARASVLTQLETLTLTNERLITERQKDRQEARQLCALLADLAGRPSRTIERKVVVEAGLGAHVLAALFGLGAVAITLCGLFVVHFGSAASRARAKGSQGLAQMQAKLESALAELAKAFSLGPDGAISNDSIVNYRLALITLRRDVNLLVAIPGMVADAQALLGEVDAELATIDPSGPRDFYAMRERLEHIDGALGGVEAIKGIYSLEALGQAAQHLDKLCAAVEAYSTDGNLLVRKCRKYMIDEVNALQEAIAHRQAEVTRGVNSDPRGVKLTELGRHVDERLASFVMPQLGREDFYETNKMIKQGGAGDEILDLMAYLVNLIVRELDGPAYQRVGNEWDEAIPFRRRDLVRRIQGALEELRAECKRRWPWVKLPEL